MLLHGLELTFISFPMDASSLTAKQPNRQSAHKSWVRGMSTFWLDGSGTIYKTGEGA